MRIVVNGEDRQAKDGVTVAELIVELGMGKGAVAAEVNKSLVPKREHAGRVLAEGDRVELVSLVGGG